MKHYRSILIILIYLISISAYFWSHSRYPSLHGKSSSGIQASIPDFLSFDALIQHTHGEIWIQQVFISFINWSYTNWEGMLFGLLIGVGFLTLLHFIDISRFPKNRFVLALIGLLNGIGLGVCANCSTPIGKSITTRGLSPILAINTIISSPSFNIIGIGLLFSIFPWHIAAVKICFYLFIIFIIVPLIFGKESLKQGNGKLLSPKQASSKVTRNVKNELTYLVQVYFSNLYYLVKKTIPLMLLGGFIGVLIISSISENFINTLEVNMISLLGISFISFLLPVPMFFDIIFSGIAYNSALPDIFAILLLLNLGGFSIYPLLVLQQNIKAQRLALFTFVFISLSIITAGGTKYFETYFTDAEIAHNVDTFFSQTGQRNYRYIKKINELSFTEINSFFEVKNSNYTSLYNDTSRTHKFKEKQINGTSVTSFPFQENYKTKSSFTVLYGEELGIAELGYRLNHMYSGIGITDYNNDQWEDIVLAGANGLNIYKNIGGKFQLDNNFSLGDTIKTGEITQANFYDLDGDNWKDLIVVSRSKGVFILWNNEGKIDIGDSINFDVTVDENYSYGMSVGDIYDDGNLDVFIGEFSVVDRSENLRNFILKNLGDRQIELEWMQKEVIGATTVGLIWDFDNDGKNEIFEGNDFAYSSDIIYNINDIDNIVFHEDMNQILPTTTYSQMGFTIGDINNDLSPEYFLSGNESSNNQNLDHAQRVEDVYSTACIFPYSHQNNKLIQQKELACEVKELVLISSIRGECQTIENTYLKGLCETLRMSGFRNNFDTPALKAGFCNSIKENFHFSVFYEYCLGEDTFKLKNRENQKTIIPQNDNNILLMSGSNITHTVENLYTGWSWGAFFADIDNNGFQDLFVGNGHLHSNKEKETNKLLMNYSGALIPKEQELGIESFLDTLTASYIDYDNDGDLDLINTTIFGDIIFFRNDLSTGNSVIVDLHDTLSQNSEAIGAKVIVTNTDGTQQIRYIYVGGHFLSAQNTQVHFGFKQGNELKSIEVIWPDGDKTKISEGLTLNHKYIIKR